METIKVVRDNNNYEWGYINPLSLLANNVNVTNFIAKLNKNCCFEPFL